MTTRAGNILRQAASIVDGARNKAHGDKERSFDCIAELWNIYLKHARTRSIRHDVITQIDGGDVAQLMVLLKMARTLYGEPVEDHYLDQAGYSAIAGELSTEPSSDQASACLASYTAVADPDGRLVPRRCSDPACPNCT